MAPQTAFPSHGSMGEVVEPGMTLRDYFAAHAPPMPPALREIAKRQETRDGKDTSNFGAFAELEADWRFAYARAMLKKRGE